MRYIDAQRAKPYDQVINDGLLSRGWRVIRIWEHVGALGAAEAVAEAVRGVA